MTTQEPASTRSPHASDRGELTCGHRTTALPSQVGTPGAASFDTSAEELWNDHGQRVYSLAYALLGDETAAMHAVALGMVDLVRSGGATSVHDIGCALARHVYLQSTALSHEASRRTGLPPAMQRLAQLADLQRASIALCAFGGHTYGCAAGVLDIAPSTVAQLLTSGLAEISRLLGPVDAAGARGVASPAVLVR